MWMDRHGDKTKTLAGWVLKAHISDELGFGKNGSASTKCDQKVMVFLLQILRAQCADAVIMIVGGSGSGRWVYLL